MTTNNPTVVGGLVYNELTLSLAVSPLVKPNFLSASVVLSLQPARRNEDGTIEVLTEPEYRKGLVFSDVFTSNDMQVMTALGKVQAAIQELIDLKNL
ncbi:hypothetical protein [Spirosoma spitsbergense]|uniref:hypothetical protein n=1 Tax=Spirosoma spitsbergense TaxID=431554 RepID=UPI00036E2FEE|nr:hypothetical protein [Spirosoma spitsbergense]